MADVLLSSLHLLERMAREEQQLKKLGLHAQAAGVRVAITILLRETAAEEPLPPIDTSED